MKFIARITLLLALIAAPAGVYFSTDFEKSLERDRIEFIEREKYCVRQALWYEARSEPEQGMRAVATVLVNRKMSNKYPDTYCGVVYQWKQFSYVHQRRAKGLHLEVRPKKSEMLALQKIDAIVHELFDAKFTPVLPKTVLWYHTIRVNPSWTKRKKTVKVIGSHVFKEL